MPREDWALDDPEYSPEKFYTHAVDERGHSAWVKLRVEPWMTSKIEEIFDSKRFPYKKKTDFYRDAIYHRLYALANDLHPFEEDPLIHLMMLHSRLEAQRQQFEAVERTLDSLEDALRRFISAGAKETAREWIRRAARQAPSGYPELAEYYRNELRMRFGRYLAQLGGSEDDLDA